MREDAPAARMMPANEGERAMRKTISYLVALEIVHAANAVDQRCNCQNWQDCQRIDGIDVKARAIFGSSGVPGNRLAITENQTCASLQRKEELTVV
jgi:hypothetical protein